MSVTDRLPSLNYYPSADIAPAPDFVTAFTSLTLALSDIEYAAAGILDFDPEAALAPGALLSPDAEDDRIHQIGADRFPVRTWRQLARACRRSTSHYDDDLCLRAFIAERSLGGPEREPAEQHHFELRSADVEGI